MTKTKTKTGKISYMPPPLVFSQFLNLNGYLSDLLLTYLLTYSKPYIEPKGSVRMPS